MPPKRKTQASPTKGEPAPKKAATSTTTDIARYSSRSHLAEQNGIVQRAFYPPEISNERCQQYTDGTLPTPYAQLTERIRATEQQRAAIPAGDAVVHWFKRDLRLHDNKPLAAASALARTHNIPLICLFVLSPQDYAAHTTSPARVDFELRTLHILKDDLAALAIPLYIDTVPDRTTVPAHIAARACEWRAHHVFTGVEYEVDELRRERRTLNACLAKDIAFNPLHDDLVVPPGALATGQGRQFAVYSPFYRAWVAHVHAQPETLDEAPPPQANGEDARTRFADAFEARVPDAPADKALPDAEMRTRLANLWPAGEHEARARLDKFLAEKAGSYKEQRNVPGANATSMLSAHFAAGTMGARTAVRCARAANTAGKGKLDAGNAGFVTWVSEVVWREFYRHVVARWPFTVMHKCFKPEYTDIEWEYDDAAFARWAGGTTGFPIVDAAMRQANYMAYIHNRCRMIVASFLAKDLLIDWRMGERWFMEHLIDGDFASNHGGWGFSSSTGVDPQPYFRIFNPLLQSEKFDPSGDYIRHWVPELRGIPGAAVHDPYARGAGDAAERAGYPRAMLEHRVARERALARYKAGLGRTTA